MKVGREAPGFTFTEIVTAVVIVGILSSAAVGYYLRATERERFDAARDVLLTIYTGEEVYLNLNGRQNYVPNPPGTLLGNCCLATWRAIFVDPPDDDQVSYGVTSSILPGSPPTPRVTAFADFRGRRQAMNQDKTLCPPNPLASCGAAGTLWSR